MNRSKVHLRFKLWISKRRQRWSASSVEVNKCKNEDWTRWKDPAIRGLHSNWINDRIIASQRPSDRIIEEFNIVEQFEKHHVKAVFNLQEPGEHPYCGDGLVNLRVGFSYTPEKLQSHGISVYNFHWEDLTNPNIKQILKNITLMDMHIGKGEAVLVHCHAGQGRTALVIAAYLMYKNITTSTEDTIKYLRSQRQKCLKKQYNREYLKIIDKEFRKLRQMFPVQGEHFRYTVEDIISNQKVLFHGPERVKYKFIPKVLDLCLIKLYQLIESGQYDEDEICDSFLLVDNLKNNFEDETMLNEVKESINQGKWKDFIEKCNKPEVIAQLFLDFCESLHAPIMSVKSLQEVDNTFQKSMSFYSCVEENKDKKALHEVFEDDAKVNPKKVIFHIICKMLGFLRVFREWDNHDLLVDRLLVALMHKKAKLAETSFIARSMISGVSDEDQEISMLSHVFNSILSHDDFVEFNMSPLPRKKRHIRDMHALSVSNKQNSVTGLNPTEKRVQNFINHINLLESNDKEFFLTKLDKINKEAKNHFQSVANSPTFLHKVPERGTEQDSGQAEGTFTINLNAVRHSLEQNEDEEEDNEEIAQSALVELRGR